MLNLYKHATNTGYEGSDWIWNISYLGKFEISRQELIPLEKKKNPAFFAFGNLHDFKATFTGKSQMTQGQLLTYLSRQGSFWPQASDASALKIVIVLSVFL